MVEAREESLMTFYRMYPGAPAPQRADLGLGGSMPARAYDYCEPFTAATGFGWHLFPPSTSSSSALDFHVPGQDDPQPTGVRLRAAAAQWAASGAVLRAEALPDGRVQITDTRPGAWDRAYTLAPGAAWLLRYLERPTTENELISALRKQRPDLYLRGTGAAGCRRALGLLVERGLVFREGEHLLALPVPRGDAF